jgi:putative glutamine amidotransferase
LGAGTQTVNSRHHQAVTPGGLAKGLTATARCEGLVEAVESDRHSWVVGVQWHPERLEEDQAFNASSRRLFAAFAAAVARGA